MHPESTLEVYTAADGRTLAVQDWPLAAGRAARGTVLIVHGLGEHAGRYERVARRLNAWGYSVRGYDHWGHGESDGARGSLPDRDCLVRDLAEMVESTRRNISAGSRLILLGHSLGGLVAASLVARDPAAVDGLVLSSPALDPGLNLFKKLLLATLPRIAPDLRVGNGLDANFLSHDSEVVAAYVADPRVHDRISARLARFIADESACVIARAPQWSVPTLLLYAGMDHLVNPEGSRAFARAAPARVVTVRCFEELYHEIFNEVENEPVFAELQRWLDDH